MQLSPGAMIGPYRVVEPTGSGGMGHVYKAWDTRLDRPVALKIVREDFLNSREHLQRFEREARTIATLTHPNICVLHDVVVHEGQRLLVMEYLEGETLAARLQQGALKEAAALSCAREIAAGLAAAHARSVVHRDLKPSNVILTKNGAKLLDFGLATAVPVSAGARDAAATASVLTQNLEIVGTLPYMAPERLEGRVSDVRGDVFAFGALLYEMFAARPAFNGDSPASVIACVLSAEPEPIPGLAPAIDRVIRKCLAKDPDDRWQTIGDAMEGLALASTPVSASAAQAGGRVNRGWMAAAVMATAAVVLFGALWLGGYFAAARRPVIVLMDSTVPERVYDAATRQAGGTNSDDITDALRGLPVELHKETTSPVWKREEQVVDQDPALIMMHLSSFAEAAADSSHQPKALERTQSFLGFVGLARPKTRFVVYTRSYATEDERRQWVDATVARFPALRGRLYMMHVPGDDKASFRDPATRELVHQHVQMVLGSSIR